MKSRFMIYWAVTLTALIFATASVTRQAQTECQERLTQARNDEKDSARLATKMFDELHRATQGDHRSAETASNLAAYYEEADGSPRDLQGVVQLISQARQQLLPRLSGSNRAEIATRLVRLQTQVQYRVRILEANEALQLSSLNAGSIGLLR